MRQRGGEAGVDVHDALGRAGGGGYRVLVLLVGAGHRRRTASNQPAAQRGAGGAARAPPALAPNARVSRSPSTYFNRPIVVLRARVLGRPPSERAAIAGAGARRTRGGESNRPDRIAPASKAASLIFVGSRLAVGLALRPTSTNWLAKRSRG